MSRQVESLIISFLFVSLTLLLDLPSSSFGSSSPSHTIDSFLLLLHSTFHVLFNFCCFDTKSNLHTKGQMLGWCKLTFTQHHTTSIVPSLFIIHNCNIIPIQNILLVHSIFFLLLCYFPSWRGADVCFSQKRTIVWDVKPQQSLGLLVQQRKKKSLCHPWVLVGLPEGRLTRSDVWITMLVMLGHNLLF